jgi:hypothetical protein
VTATTVASSSFSQELAAPHLLQAVCLSPTNEGRRNQSINRQAIIEQSIIKQPVDQLMDMQRREGDIA